MFFHTTETLPRHELELLQVERLKKTIEKALHSPFYQEHLKNISSESINCVDDIKKIPFTTKDNLRANYPYGLLTQAKEDFVRMHVSSGTTGTPTAIFYTQNDLDSWSSLVARSMYATGIRKTDVFQNMSGYGLFTGGLGFHYGSEHLGALTIPAGAGNTARQIKLIKDFSVTAIHILPSYALHFAQSLMKDGIDPKKLSLRIALVGAEPHTEETRKHIEELLDIKAFNSYGLTEMNGPGVAFECIHQSGMHIWEDCYLAEIIDPDTCEPVADGEIGELVLTTLTREGMPIIRYRTRDLTRFIEGTCPCGRTHRRIDRIAGRSDDMIIVKGVNIYPMQIEQVLMNIPEVGLNYQIELFNEGLLDQIRVKVEIKSAYFVEDMRVLQGIQKRITSALSNEILVTPRVELMQNGSIPQTEGKAQRVIDLRNK